LKARPTGLGCDVNPLSYEDSRQPVTTTDDCIAVSLSGRRGLLAAVPALLGFHPAESLVAICLNGSRRGVGPVMRIDLPEPGGTRPSEGSISDLRANAARLADEVVLVCYTERPRPAVLDMLLAGLRRDGVRVLDVICVRAGRAFTAPTAAAELRAVGEQLPGHDDPQLLLMQAATAMQGRGMLPDREALRRSIAGPTRAASAAATDLAAGRLLRMLGRPIDSAGLGMAADTLLDRALIDVGAGRRIASGDPAMIALLLADVTVRDAVVVRAVTEMEEPWLPVLIAAAGALPDADCAELCAVLAMAAYRRGDGALAQVAIDRTLSADPAHRLSRLLLGVMASGMPPAELALLATSAQQQPAADDGLKRGSAEPEVSPDAVRWLRRPTKSGPARKGSFSDRPD